VPFLLTAAEHAARWALHRTGVTSRRIETPVGRMHVLDGRGGGDGAPIVLLHGIGASATPYAPVLARVRPHVRRVIAPDLPGHGFSEAPPRGLDPDRLFEVVRDALDTVLDGPAVICGGSLGGALALRYAAERPHRTAALVLLSPAGARLTEDELDTLRGHFDMKDRRDALAFGRRLYHRPPRSLPLVAGEIRARLSRDVVRDLLASARTSHAVTPETLAGLTMPVVLVWGRSERLLPPSALAYFRAHLPAHARIEEPEGLGHCPHLDDPAQVARVLLEAARRSAPPDPSTAPG
jgi:pimeloyl-ACP methyl ester carboxylesterase